MFRTARIPGVCRLLQNGGATDKNGHHSAAPRATTGLAWRVSSRNNRGGRGCSLAPQHSAKTQMDTNRTTKEIWGSNFRSFSRIRETPSCAGLGASNVFSAVGFVCTSYVCVHTYVKGWLRLFDGSSSRYSTHRGGS